MIDLFAGCGGLSLGLEMAGFEPVFVNELDHGAMASYLDNRAEYPALAEPRGNSNDIFEVTGKPGELHALVGHVRSHLAVKDLDLVVGGPPCQGYSGIGHRRTFTGSASSTSRRTTCTARWPSSSWPSSRKMFLFENVKGLLSSRWTPDGEKGEIWEDVRQTFEQIEGYDVRPQLVQAKWYGVPRTGRASCWSASATTSVSRPTRARWPTAYSRSRRARHPTRSTSWATSSTRCTWSRTRRPAYPIGYHAESQRFFRTAPDGRHRAPR